MKCRACGKEGIRKASNALVLAEGKIKGGRVCQACVAGGALLVAHKLPPVSNTLAIEAKSTKEVLKPFINLFQSQLEAYRRIEFTITPDGEEEFVAGKIEALAGVIEVLKRGRT